MTLSMYIRRAVVTALLGLGILVPALAFAETGVDAALQSAAAVNATTNTNASVRTEAGVGAKVAASSTISAAVMTRAKTKADTEIDRRVKALNELNARIQLMTKVQPEFKTNINTNIQAQVTGLAALKVKIDGNTDGATLRTDVQSITVAYRIYALIMPQARIAAAADREATIINMLAGIGAKLQARVQAAATAGADVTALNTALTDMAAKLASAQTHAQAAINGSATLSPDGGDAAKMKANDTALRAARAEIEAAHKDLLDARKDIDTVLKGLRQINAAASASTTTQTP